MSRTLSNLKFHIDDKAALIVIIYIYIYQGVRNP